MKYLAILAAALSLLLAGCATTIRSDVTAFHQWPAALAEKTYVFDTPPPAQDTLEYRNYLGILRAELARQGFTEAANARDAKLKVALQFSTVDRPLRVIEPIDPFWDTPGYWHRGYFGRPWGMRGYWPYYDPFLYGSPYARETIRHVYERQVRIEIASIDGKKLFDVTVHNNSSTPATPVVMQALIASAFTDFPGPNGVPHEVALTLR
jgi:hypothetical protein